jgi:HD-like signal output (HDOD) protein
MGTVRINNLKPGMVLAEDVRDIKGRLLLTGGKSVGPDHIRIFKMWGITQAEITGIPGEDDAAPEPAVDPRWLEIVSKETEKLFCCTDRGHPAVQEIFTQAVNFRSTRRSVQPAPELPPQKPSSANTSQPADFLQKLMANNISLPEIPSIVLELNEVIAHPFSSTHQVAQVINKSPSLTAQLLKTVNSAFYGLPSQVDRVSIAVTMIGTRELSTLALGLSIMSVFKDIPRHILSMQSFLRHSLACGIISRLLAAHKNMRQTEQIFTSGLLHDLGRLVLFIYFPAEAFDVMRYAAEHSMCLYAAEKERLGCHHSQIGKFLLDQWRLPLSLEDSVCFHHEPEKASAPIPAAIVHVADILVNALGIGASGERFVPPLSPKAWQALDLPTSCFETTVKQAVHHIASLEFLLPERLR